MMLADRLRRQAVVARRNRHAAVAERLESQAYRVEEAARPARSHTCPYCGRSFPSLAGMVARVSHNCNVPVSTTRVETAAAGGFPPTPDAALPSTRVLATAAAKDSAHRRAAG